MTCVFKTVYSSRVISMNDQDSLPPNAVILVTGATGFVGAYVVRDLILAGYRVKAMRRKKLLPFFVDSEILRRAEWIEGDIMDIPAMDEALQGADAIVHAAAMVSFKPSEAEEMFRINIEGTANMVNLAIEHGIKKFIHVSSVSAIGREKNDVLVNESGTWSGKFRQTRYGVSKQRAEMEVWRGIAEGLNAVIINPATILGIWRLEPVELRHLQIHVPGISMVHDPCQWVCGDRRRFPGNC